MSVQVEKLEKNMAKLIVEIEASEVEKAINKAYNKEKSRITVSGFRKGKAPRQIIEKMYGAEVFYEEAVNIMLNDTYPAAMEESGLDIVSRPTIDVVQMIEKGKSFVYSAEVALKPEVEVKDYKGVKVSKRDVQVTDEDVEEKVLKDREMNARVVEVTDRPVQDKDMVIIDFEGFVNGEAFEGGKGTDYPLTIGSHSFIDTFEEQLIGKNIGEEVEVNVTFPDEYHSVELQGKKAMFKVTVNKISCKELPELDDEFAEEISECETVAEYKEQIKNKLQETKEKEARAKKEDEVIQKLIDNTELELPDPMVDMQVESMERDFQNRLSAQGLSLEVYLQYTGLTKEKFADQLKPQAVANIKSRLILEAIAKQEGIEVTDDELNEEIENMAKSYGITSEEFSKFIRDEEKNSIIADVKVKKAIKLVTDEAVESEDVKAEDEEA